MTQDQYGQAPGTGYVVRGDVVPDDETEISPDEQSAPMTRFQRVASTLRGDHAEAPDGADAAPPGEVGAVRSPETADRDYWDNEDDTDGTRDPSGTEPAATGVSTGEPGVMGKHAAGAVDAGLRPGEATDRLGDFGDIAFGNLLPDAEQYTAQWQQIQFRFVDDPQGSVTEAADTISQVTTKLEAAIQERQRAIQDRQQAIQERASALRGRWGEGSNADTETLRETLRMYRAFMDQLIGRTS
jgi:hypothetical protein